MPMKRNIKLLLGVFAIAGGSWVGVGLRNGRPKDIPVPTSDFIFSVISEQFGLIIAVIIIIIFFIIILRGISIALRATEEFYSLVVICLLYTSRCV